MKTRRQNGTPALTLVEEAFHLVRRAPITALMAYYTGSLPFVLGLAYFWTFMNKRVASDEVCAQWALGLALLFLWMKCWHTVYGQRLLAETQGGEPAPWPLSRILRMAAAQTILQPLGLIVLPFALLMTIPFAWAYMLFQNISVLGDGSEPSLRALTRRCGRLAAMWPWQNHVCMWLLSPALLVMVGVLIFGVTPILTAALPDSIGGLAMVPTVALSLASLFLCPVGALVLGNIMSVMAVIPMLLRTLFGIDTPFSASSALLEGPTAAFIAFGLTYLALDPFIKAAAVLRCFYGESYTTGADLKAELRRWSRNAAVLGGVSLVALLLGACPVAHAGEVPPSAAEAAPVTPAPAIDAETLDRAIDDVLSQQVYDWRGPKAHVDDANKGLLIRFIEAVRDTLVDWTRYVFKLWRKFQDWLNKQQRHETQGKTEDRSVFQWRNVAEPLLYLLLAGLLCLALAMSWRAWRVRSALRAAPVAYAPLAVPDVEDESVLANALPEDEWVALARTLVGQGNYRLALRALFLASLANLAQREYIRIAKFKSNRDYQRELDRRGHAVPDMQDLFRAQVDQFERVWYGTQDATTDLVERFVADQERMRHGVA